MRTTSKSIDNHPARPGRPFTIRGRPAVATEGLSGGPPGWQKLRDAAEAFWSQGHSASGATVAERMLGPRER